MNNLDPEVAERPEDLVVYGGLYKAARRIGPAYDAIVRSLRDLEDDETLLVQSGKPVGVMRTLDQRAPRVLIANSNLVGDWANGGGVPAARGPRRRYVRQMTAGSWIYIGTQGILQGTFETFAAVADKRFGGTLAGTITLTAGLGGMGGAQPLAVTMNDGVAICIDVDQSRITRRTEHRYLDEQADSLEDAVARAVAARYEPTPALDRRARQRGRVRAAGRARRRCDVVTDQTSAHDPLSRTSRGCLVRRLARRGRPRPGRLHQGRPGVDGRARARDGRVPGRRRRGVRLRQLDPRRGSQGRLRPGVRVPGVRAGEHPAALLRGTGPVPLGRAVGRPGRHRRHRPGDPCGASPTTSGCGSGSRWPASGCTTRGCRRGICWLGYGERHLAGLSFNEMVASGGLKAPIVIGRDHLDCGSVASPYRETESMLDGWDAIADWAILNALVNTASGATWGALSNDGGGVGTGRSLHAGQVCVADGTDLAAQKIERVLYQRPRHGRHPACRRGRPGGRGGRRSRR